MPSGKYQARYWHFGKQIAAEHTYAGKITFGGYASWWIEQRPVRPRTKQIYEGQLKHITPTFAGVSLYDIRPIDVRSWHGQLSRGPLHQNTIAKISRLFRTIMSTVRPGGHRRIRGLTLSYCLEHLFGFEHRR